MAASVHGVVRASVDADAIISVAIPKLRDLQQRCDPDDPIAAVLALTDEHTNRVDLLTGLRGLEPAGRGLARGDAREDLNCARPSGSQLQGSRKSLRSQASELETMACRSS